MMSDSFSFRNSSGLRYRGQILNPFWTVIIIIAWTIEMAWNHRDIGCIFIQWPKSTWIRLHHGDMFAASLISLDYEFLGFQEFFTQSFKESHSIIHRYDKSTISHLLVYYPKWFEQNNLCLVYYFHVQIPMCALNDARLCHDANSTYSARLLCCMLKRSLKGTNIYGRKTMREGFILFHQTITQIFVTLLEIQY